MTDEEIPEYIIEAEREMFDWGYHGPVKCMVQSEDKSPERKLEIFESEFQYHLGCFIASQFICNRLYKIEGFEDRYYDEHHPPWMEEAVEYQEELREEINDG